ncbi:MAG: sugar transferase [Bacteroidales bacterium]|nr:sugar transferase [Bacteroidales bacterium]
MAKRLFDIAGSLLGIIALLPLFMVIAIWIAIDSPGVVIFRQRRVGRYGKEFWLLKFRSMHRNSMNKGLLTLPGDPRITGAGRWLRKHKLDELPQLVNILSGRMSFVGPRPEVRKYVELYTESQKKVLTVRPGLTDPVSIAFADENGILERYADPEKAYIEEIMPSKIALNLKYIENRSFFKDLSVILKTLGRVFRQSRINQVPD